MRTLVRDTPSRWAEYLRRYALDFSHHVRSTRGSLANEAYVSACLVAHSLVAPKPTFETLFESKQGVIVRVDGGIFIDPKWGYAITRRGVVIESSVVNGDVGKACLSDARKPGKLSRAFKMGVPSPFRFLVARRALAHRPAERRQSLLSLRYLYEWNYYHFLFDVIGRLELVSHSEFEGFDGIVLGPYVDEVGFAREIIESGNLSEFDFLVPRSEFVFADSVILCESRRAHKDISEFLRTAVTASRKGAVPPEEDRRVYLRRNGTRRCVNFEELAPLLERFGFVVVDPGALSFAEQVHLFERTRFLLADHGAGTTNIIFRGDRPLSVVEMHHDEYMQYDHRAICQEYGHEWSEVVGKRAFTPGLAARHDDFVVDPRSLEVELHRLLTLASR